MRNAAALLVLFLSTSLLVAAPAPIRVEAEPLGDTPDGVVARLTFRFDRPSRVAPDAEITLSGAITGMGVTRTFRIPLRPDDVSVASTIVTMPAGAHSVDARLIVESEDVAPTIVAKVTAPLTISATGKEYAPASSDGAEGVIALGLPAEARSAVTIRPPRRDMAPNLFKVDVDTAPSVKRVEFWVAEKKIFTRNRPPFTAELDLGSTPKRVEIRVVGFGAKGEFLDADAWIVNERETPLEVKITRTKNGEGESHFKVSVQSAKSYAMKSVELFADEKKLASWSSPPYATSVKESDLAGAKFVRATAIDSEGVEASDILFLDGRRFAESIEVNLVQLPVNVVDTSGAVLTDLKESDFEILENGKPMKVSTFGFSSDLPLSVGVLVDHSGSMEPRIEEARKAAIEFFKQTMTARDRAFFGGFSWEATNVSPLTSDLVSLQRQIDSMAAAEGGTALYDAIITGLYAFRGVEGRKALLIVTDGEDTVSRIDFDRMLDYVRVARVPLYFIGVSMSPILHGGKLKALAAETGGVAWFVSKAADLAETYRQLDRELRSQYLIGYYADGGGEGKYRTVEVKVNRAGARVRTIRGFLP